MIATLPIVTAKRCYRNNYLPNLILDGSRKTQISWQKRGPHDQRPVLFSPSPTSLQRVSFVGAPGKTIQIGLNHFRPEPTASLQARATQIHACHLRLTPTAGSQVRIEQGCSNRTCRHYDQSRSSGRRFRFRQPSSVTMTMSSTRIPPRSRR